MGCLPYKTKGGLSSEFNKFFLNYDAFLTFWGVRCEDGIDSSWCVDLFTVPNVAALFALLFLLEVVVLLLLCNMVPSWVEEYPEKLFVKFYFKLTDGVKSLVLLFDLSENKPPYLFDLAFAEAGVLLNSSKLVSLYIFL